MALDYSFFALLFMLASSFAPDATAELTWVNGSHPEQAITWTPEGQGWELRVNGREVGIFQRDGDAIVHHTGQGPPRRFPFARLAAAVTPDATRVTLRGTFAPGELRVEREGGRVTLIDPGRELLRAPLILRAR